MRRGLTLIELLISILLLTITFVGGMAFYFYSNRHLQTAFHRRIVAEIANSRMEEIRKSGYGNLTNGCTNTIVPIAGLITGGNETVCINGTTYKEVSVEIDWQDPGKISQQSVRLDTYIVP